MPKRRSSFDRLPSGAIQLRILVSDYSGHPFQIELSRALAGRGHEVCHVHCASFQTPKGRLERAPDDPPTFSVAPVTLAEPFRKDSFVKRRGQEIAIGKAIGERIAAFAPDVVLSSNAPLDCQRQILAATRTSGAGFVFWVQDIYSRAIGLVLARKLSLLGRAIGAYYRRMEARLLRRSDGAVLIAEDFVAPVRALAGPALPLTVIQNWAPLAELPQHPRDNAWARQNLAPAEFRILYSGTLGFKHDPDAIVALAQAGLGDVLVFSEGPGADYLRTQAVERGLANLKVSGWLDFADMPFALAAADVLLVILEADAGQYSVPSKTLTYLCAGRPILGAMPAENLAARLVEGNDAGMVVAPGDHAALVERAARLAAEPERRKQMGANARAYAEKVFAINGVCDRFEVVLEQACTPNGGSDE